MIISWMLFAVVTGGFLTAAALAADRLASFSRRPRRFVWLTTLVLTAFWPVFSILSAWLPRLQSSRILPEQLTAPGRLGTLVVAAPGWELSSRWTWIVVIVWLLCSSALFARFGMALVYARRRKASWQEMDIDGMPVHVAGDVGPAVVGLQNMAIVLPRWVTEAEPTLRALILRHEAEHRAARDPYLLLIAAVLTALVPWNIPLWFQARRLRLAIELDCDQRVLRAHPSWREYARLLLTIAQQRSTGSHRLAPALLEPASNLERRIIAMRTTSGLSRLNAFCLTIAATAAFAVACAVDKPESPIASKSSQQLPGRTTRAVPPPQLDPRQTFFEFQVEKLATPIAQPHIDYPPSLKAAGITGSVFAQYVVDPSGHVDVNTFKVLNDVDPRFTAAIRATVPTWQFEPATVGGRKVSQLVQQAFQFGT